MGLHNISHNGPEPPTAKMAVGAWMSSLYTTSNKFWPLVILSTGLSAIIPLGETGRVINLSLFDFIVPVLFLVVVRDRAIKFDKILVSMIIGSVGLIILHTSILIITAQVGDLTGLARETIKTAAFFIQVLMLIMIIRAGEIKLPSLSILTFLFILLSVSAIGLHFEELYSPGSWFLPRNQYLASLSGIIIFSAIICSFGRESQIYLVMSICIFFVISLLFFNKTYLIIGSVYVALLPYLRLDAGQRYFRRICVICAALLMVVLTVLFSSGDMLRDIMVLERLDTLGNSLGFRIELWTLAREAALDYFPIGIGLGQFSVLLSVETNLVEQGLRYIHNTPLALVTEMGLVGLIIIGIICSLLQRSTRDFPIALRVAVWINFCIPALIHDVLGFRMLVIVLAFGLAGTINSEFIQQFKARSVND